MSPTFKVSSCQKWILLAKNYALSRNRATRNLAVFILSKCHGTVCIFPDLAILICYINLIDIGQKLDFRGSFVPVFGPILNIECNSQIAHVCPLNSRYLHAKNWVSC